MPSVKKDTTPGMRLVHLYWLLLFTRREYSLSELSRKLDCSKATVLRYLSQLESSPLGAGLQAEKRAGRLYVRLRSSERPRASLRPEDIEQLLLCRDMVWSLLPPRLREELNRAIAHSRALVPDPELVVDLERRRAQPWPKGAIDYTAQEEAFTRLLQAMDQRRICRVAYRKPGDEQDRVHLLAPDRLLVHHETLYVQGWRFWEDDPHRRARMTLALQRVRGVELTEQTCHEEAPPLGHTFGIIQDDPFRVRVAFAPSAACYVRERIWSQDQRLEPQPDGGVVLEFTATSRPEVVAWVLSFGATAQVLEPPELAREVGRIAQQIAAQYLSPSDPER
jgi:predicted DNA-binding transcriptional regulator YafY